METVTQVDFPKNETVVSHVKHSSVSMSIPDSLTIPSPILLPGDHKLITEYLAEFPVL